MNKVNTNIIKNKPDIKKGILKEKYHSILKKSVIKTQESTKAKNNEKQIMGTKIIRDSNSNNLIIPIRS